MRTRSQTRNRNRQQQSQPAVVQPFHLEEPFVNPPLVPMADNRTMAQLLQAPTEGYEDAIVIPEINANFELKHGLINLVQNKQFFGHDKEDPHAHIRYFNKITSTMRFPDIPSTSIKLMLFPFSLEGSARIWLEKEPPRSILTWDDLVSKFINKFFLPSKTTNLRNEITRFQQRFDESFYEAWDRFNDLLRACPHHGFSELHQLDTFYNALNANYQDSLNSAAGGNILDKMPRECLRIIEYVAALTTEVSELKNMMKTMLIDKQKAQAPASVKAVEQSCVTCGGAHSYRNCPATDGNVYRDNIQEYVSQAAAANFNQGNTNSRPPMVANQIRPPVPPPKDHDSIFIEIPKPKAKKTVQEPNSTEPNSYQPKLPYPERMKVRERDTPKCHDRARFMKLFKQLRLEIGLKDALIEMLKFNKWLSTLLRNKEKLKKIAITTVNAKCSAIILHKIPEKLEDPSKFLIPYKPFSGGTTNHFDALPPSSSPVKTSDNLEEFADELTLLKKGVHEENFQVYSNPLFEFDDNFTSSNEKPLFNEKEEDVKNENSNVSNSDEPVFLNTPLSDKVECFDPEDDIDEIDAFLAMEVSSNFEEGYFDSEGDIIFLENLLSDDTTHNLASKVISEHEPKQNESIHNTSITFSPRSDPLHHEFAGELLTLPSRIAREHEEYLSRMTLLCEISTSRSQENVHANPSSIIESIPTSPIPVEDSEPVQEEIDIFLVLDDLIPPGVENDDSKDEDNSTFSSPKIISS
ncbi:reverse transcriptase domain-containing protein [Tanacetum coccineum]